MKLSSDGSERTYIQGSSENISQNGSYPENQIQSKSAFEITEEKREKMKNTVNKIRARKREQKRLRRNKEDTEKNSSKGSNLTLSEERKDYSDKIFPQKRKSTIWKILFPKKTFEHPDCDLERLVCSQVENQIAKNEKVIECYRQLRVFEDSEEAKSMTKADFIKQKNRISAQLSRERREAIMHSLIDVCLNNIKAKKELDADIEEVKQVLKESL